MKMSNIKINKTQIRTVYARKRGRKKKIKEALMRRNTSLLLMDIPQQKTTTQKGKNFGIRGSLCSHKIHCNRNKG